MRPIYKAFLFSLVVFLLSFLPLLADQTGSKPDLKTPSGEIDLLRERGFKPAPFPYVEPFVFPQDELARRRDVSFPNSTVAPLTLAEHRVMKAIIDDFLVNDDIIGGCNQTYPAIARNPSGNFVITWGDVRNLNYDIYAQRYDSSGTPVGASFKVNDDTGTQGQATPAVAMDAYGNFVITWDDDRNGNSDIYAQKYYLSGEPIDSNFKVNDDTGTSDQARPDIAIDGSGNFVVTWDDGRSGNSDIYAQRYNSSGAPVGANFKVNDDTGTVTQGAPSIAMNYSGDYVITWDDDRNGNSDIYAQRYDFPGTPLGSNFKVNDDIGTQTQAISDVAMDTYGNFVITWSDGRNISTTFVDIYAQRYDSLGAPIGANFRVDDDAVGFMQIWSAICMDSSGNFVITWRDHRNWNEDIYAQRYSPSGTPLGVNFKVNDDAGTAYQRWPDIAIDGSGNFVITWEDYRNGNGNLDIYAQRYDFSGTPVGANFKVNDDIGTSDQVRPDIAMDGSGNFVVTWDDGRNGNIDIYAQIYNTLSTPLGSNFKVNDDAGTVTQGAPSIAMNYSGGYVITWDDGRSGNSDIYVQRYNSSGTPLGSNLKVNDDVGTAWQGSPNIAMDVTGSSVVTWRDDRNGPDIYAQRYYLSGERIGSNFKVNDDAGTAYQGSPAIAIYGYGSFIIAWQDKRNGNYDIYTQRYDAAATPLGTNFKVNDDADTAVQEYPTIATDSSGNFVVAWVDYRNGNSDIYAQRYDAAATPLGTNFKVNDDAGTTPQYFPDIDMNDYGDFVIVWEDYPYDNPDIFAQRYNPSGNPLDSNYLIPNPGYAAFHQQLPAVAVNGCNISFAWMDNRRAKGWDIYAKVTDWLWTIYCGDANGDSKVTVSDVVYLVNYLFKGGPAPDPIQKANVNCNDTVSVSDVVYLVNYLFKGGPKAHCR